MIHCTGNDSNGAHGTIKETLQQQPVYNAKLQHCRSSAYDSQGRGALGKHRQRQNDRDTHSPRGQIFLINGITT